MAMNPITPSSPSNDGQQPQSLWQRTFDPRSRLIINWNRFVFFILIFDIFSLFIIRVDYNDIGIDFRLAYPISLLRAIGDSFQFLGMLVKFRTAIDDLANRIFKRDPTIIAKKYFKSSFIFEFVATLPLLEVYLWSKLPSLKASTTPYSSSSFLRGLIKILSIQISSKFFVVFPFKGKLLETRDIIMRPAWAGVLYYLLFYIMLSQSVGAAYYLSYVYRLFELPFFASLDHELVHSFIGHLRIFSCSKETYVVIEGDLCGSELLTWASLLFASIQLLPSSSQSIKCLTNVEAFSLLAEDLKLLGIHFSYCWKFQQALRWHS